MPPRGKRPGFKRGRHGLPYWIARQVTKDPKGFADTCIPLPPDADDAEIDRLCVEHTERLRAYLAQLDREPTLTRTRYDGTVRSACRIYQEHPQSDFQSVKHTTQKFYLTCLRRIEASVGARLIRNVTILDLKHWYTEWRKPQIFIDAESNETVGPERIDRAHDTVSMVRTVIYFMSALGHPDCERLAVRFEKVKFEKGGARQEELTYAQATAFIRTALELGDRGVMPKDRARSMAIAVAAQFELLLRQKDIIGEWAKRGANRKLPQGVSVLERETESWAGFFTWENLPGWRWHMKTSKSKYRAASHFDLTQYGLLYPLLESVPLGERTGAVVKGEHGLPVRERSFGNWFRQIARAAHIPDKVWNMDTRAGGATEAYDAGAPLKDIQGALTHEKEGTTLRYIRRLSRAPAAVADVRQQKRKAADGNGGDDAGA